MGNQLEKPDSIADVNIMQHSDLEMYHWLRVMHVDKIIYRHIRSRTILAHLIQQGLSENSPLNSLVFITSHLLFIDG